jgi:DNA-binding response OmpR family regulator
MARILIIDDEPSIVLALKDELAFEGFEVDSASDGIGGLEMARAGKPDVLLLDLMLPGRNGLEVCKTLRREMPELWIIIVTVRGQEVDRVLGLEIGADDYVTKPFSLREIIARVKVGLRRRAATHTHPIQRLGNIEVDLRARRVLNRGREITLTRKEFDMLALLIEHIGEVITRDEFLNTLWGKEVYLTPRVIDTHIAALRKKLEDDPNNPHHIVGVRGVGYKLV